VLHIYLLTHPREQLRKNNTGVLAADILTSHCRIITWQRTAPDLTLLDDIKHQSMALIYPCEDGIELDSEHRFDALIILDGTWQEAQKMYNQSPYLHSLPKIKIHTSQTSIYTLRRNQKQHGLCTAECVIEILKSNGHEIHAEHLHTKLIELVRQKKLPKVLQS